MNVGSVFSGIGAGDKGLEDAGMRIIWQIEIDKYGRIVLAEHWPEIPKYRDVLGIDPDLLEPVDLIIGGDPCPIRSRARSLHGSSEPDLSGDFLLLVACRQPRWVLRENVPAPDAVDFAAGLDVLGYRSLLVEINSATFVPQRRRREYIVGCPPAAWERALEVFSLAAEHIGDRSQDDEARSKAGCLTTNPTRWDTSDNLVYEDRRGLRILLPVERERLQGLPDGWTARLSDRKRAETCGRAMTRDVIEWIARRIIDVESRKAKKATSKT